ARRVARRGLLEAVDVDVVVADAVHLGEAHVRRPLCGAVHNTRGDGPPVATAIWLLPAGHVPEPHGVVEARGGQQVAAGREGEAEANPRVAAQDGPRLAGGDVPQDDLGDVLARGDVEDLPGQRQQLA